MSYMWTETTIVIGGLLLLWALGCRWWEAKKRMRRAMISIRPNVELVDGELVALEYIERGTLVIVKDESPVSG